MPSTPAAANATRTRVAVKERVSPTTIRSGNHDFGFISFPESLAYTRVVVGTLPGMVLNNRTLSAFQLPLRFPRQ
jgi:hypothetical protein